MVPARKGSKDGKCAHVPAAAAGEAKPERGIRRSGPNATRRDPEVLVAIGLLVAVAVLGILQIGDYAITIDEWNADDYGAKAIEWYASGFTNRAMFTEVEDTLWYYGPWFHMLVSGAQRLGIGSHWDIRHALTFFCGLAGIALLLPIGRLAIGRWAGLAAITICLTSGYLYGSLFFTPIDVPFLFAMTAAVLGILVMAQGLVPSWRASIAAGLLTGLAIATRSSGFITQVYLVGAMGLSGIGIVAAGEQVRGKLARLAARTIVALLAGWIAAFCLWPWLQIGNPLQHFWEAFVYFAQHPSSWEVPHWGKQILTNELPAHYVPGQLVARLPLAVLALMVFAAMLAPWRGLSRLRESAATGRIGPANTLAALATREGRLILVLWVATFAPIAFVIASGSTLYNGLRHILFVLPLLALFAAAGFVWMLPLIRRFPVLATGAVGVYLGVQVATLAKLHPLEYIAVNSLAGGVQGASGRFEMDYWGAAATIALRRLEHRVSLGGAPNGVPPKLMICIPWREWLTPSMYRRDWQLAVKAADADYIIATEPSPGCAVGQPVVLIDEVKRFGRAFAWTYARRPGAPALLEAPP